MSIKVDRMSRADTVNHPTEAGCREGVAHATA